MATKKTTALTIKKPKLAAKPSAAIRQAIADLKAVEKDPRYRIEMDDYHAPRFGNNDTKLCEVCFAGATIARAGNSPEIEIGPYNFDEKIRNKLMALDHFRSGSIVEGLELWGVKKIPMILVNSDCAEVEVTHYDTDAVAFKKEMAEMADNLEDLGL